MNVMRLSPFPVFSDKLRRRFAILPACLCSSRSRNAACMRATVQANSIYGYIFSAIAWPTRNPNPMMDVGTPFFSHIDIITVAMAKLI